MEPHKLLGGVCHQLDVQVLGEKEVIVLSVDAGEAGIKGRSNKGMAEDSDLLGQTVVDPQRIIIVF